MRQSLNTGLCSPRSGTHVAPQSHCPPRRGSHWTHAKLVIGRIRHIGTIDTDNTTDSPVDKTEAFSHDCSSVVDTNDHQRKSNDDIQNSDNFAQLSFGRLVPITDRSDADYGVKQTVGKSPLDLGFIFMTIPTFDFDGFNKGRLKTRN